ncbi:E3 ubiquitin-protein ligase Mdm2-like [Tubulanus polymorphus]|uniref:E3 ubiquitin-protein ligase Mdm2-like n=1 Tax=Tubulanus polymorphus TaxID=672921 RepID=UPI003DA25089
MAESKPKEVYLQPTAGFRTILRAAGAPSEKCSFTKNEILLYLKQYISRRTLYNVDNPRVVHIRDDPLGKVFQIDSFTIKEVLSLISKHTTVYRDEIRQPQPGTSSPGITFDEVDGACSFGAICNRIRKRSESSSPGASNEPATKRVRSSSSISFICNEGELHISSSDETLSVQSKETNLVRSPIGSYLSGEDVIIDEIEDHTFDVEYEIATSSVENSADEDDTDIISDSEDDGPRELVIVCQESDVEFWADESETDVSSDVELSEKDKWECANCTTLNSPLQRNCIKCWEVRPGWLPDKSHYGRLPVRQRQFRRSNSAPGDLESGNTDIIPSNSRCLSNEHTVPVITSSDLVQRNSSEFTNCVDSLSKFACSTPVTYKLPSNISSLMPFKQQLNCNGLKTVQSTSSSSLIGQHTSSFDSAFGSACGSQGSDEQTPSRSICKPSNSSSQSQAYDEIDGLPVHHTLPNHSASSQSSEKRYTLSQRTPISESQSSSSSNESTFVTPTQLSLRSLNTENPGPSTSTFTDKCQKGNKCLICLSNPINASLVHGKTGHQMCCYACAKKLRRRGKPCPICRRPIQKVIKNYFISAWD